MDRTSDGFVQHAFGQLHRAEAPAIPLDALFDRWHRRQRRALAAAGALLLLAASAAVAIVAAPKEPPVHLRLRLVDVSILEAPTLGPLPGAPLEVP